MSNHKNNQITIILAKASWCGHCIHFTPIFEKAKERIKGNNDLNGSEINFVSFEMDKNEQKNQFINEYPGLIDFLEGYPTVYMKMVQGKLIRNDFINHTVIDKEKGITIDKAVDNFIDNIINQYKTNLSEKKDKYVNVQTGGARLRRRNFNDYTSMEESTYRTKYLKYKSKYLDLVNN